MEAEFKEGRYIYCIIASKQPQSFGPLGIGGRSDDLYTISFKDVAAVVSNSPIKSYSLSHENLIAHEKAIEEVMKGHTVLPVRFCTIAADDAKIKEILEKAHDKIRGLLKAMSGKKELGLKAVFKDVIYQDIVAEHGDIRTLKEKIAVLPPAQTLTARRQIGQMVEVALNQAREHYKGIIMDGLSPLATEVKINRNYGEMMVVSAAFLVDEKKETSFDQRVDQLGAKYVDKIKFKYVGTLPPFNFVNLVINTQTADLTGTAS